MRHLLPNNVHTATEYIWEMPTNNAIELTWKRSRQWSKSRRSACRTDSRTFSVGWRVLCNSSNNHMHEWTVETLALFPGHSHLQYLMAYSMQIQRGEAWRFGYLWLRHVGGAQQGISKPFLVLLVRGLEARALTRQSQYHPSFIAPGTIWHGMGITTVGHRSPYIYHLSTWRNRMWPNLPGLPPLYLHTVSDQILEVGTTWERGHGNLALLCLKFKYTIKKPEWESACMGTRLYLLWDWVE